MLTKSKGQILRISAVMHVLYHMDTPQNIPVEICEEAVKAADAFVDYCLQHAAYLGGRGDFHTAVEELQQGDTGPLFVQFSCDMHVPPTVRFLMLLNKCYCIR